MSSRSIALAASLLLLRCGGRSELLLDANTWDAPRLDGPPREKTLPPDLPPPDSSLPGQPCTSSSHCTAGYECMLQVCRAVCQVPTDPCQVRSNCPADESCVPTTSAGTWVCLPAVKPGEKCDGESLHCPVDYVCVQLEDSYATCRLSCDSASPCGGGKCIVTAAGCGFCL